MNEARFLAGLVLLGQAGCHKCGDDLKFTTDDNYSFSGTVDVPVIETAPGVSIEICFDKLTSDIQCHDTDPATDIINAGMGRFDLSPEEVNQGIADDTITAASATGYVDVSTLGATCVNTKDMSFFGTPLNVPKEYVVGQTYLVTVGESNDPGVGSRGLLILRPTEGSKTTSVSMTDQCGILEFHADLSSGNSQAVCEKGTTKVDWSEVDTNGIGAPFSPSTVNQLLLAHYDDLTADDLEAEFFDLQLLADKMWIMPLTGDVKANLEDAETDGGDKFDAFGTSGIYLLGLSDVKSPNPAPKFLTVLTPE
jgi:hypothetical protein